MDAHLFPILLRYLVQAFPTPLQHPQPAQMSIWLPYLAQPHPTRGQVQLMLMQAQTRKHFAMYMALQHLSHRRRCNQAQLMDPQLRPPPHVLRLGLAVHR